jgi:hypothetical protein
MTGETIPSTMIIKMIMVLINDCFFNIGYPSIGPGYVILSFFLDLRIIKTATTKSINATAATI